ncbi:hypothetical protein ANME2D_01966 [Candidatus Methanoperedens nitroreducens]|uniref:Uncharacterized protein n=1 Tax=Candidatus Methanoperedens nitratireducens TaxID=1392998 RepID=A0A062V992_9EURY|nr:hypothetical protein [Candidatus Methanoperedens nitroreducens]KCZ71910.1 hypothetical protein ANME2D_01966 [Candidatus Methanoperedens nitroreducens]MDJ1422116.1 hypothetical protein [Candidatus Methanoperedens sp.]
MRQKELNYLFISFCSLERFIVSIEYNKQKVMNNPIKVLLIGFEESPKAESGMQIELCRITFEKHGFNYDFKGKHIIPSLLDYNVVFVNLPKIGYNSASISYFFAKYNEIPLFLTGGGIIVLICPSEKTYANTIGIGPYSSINTYSFLPFKLNNFNTHGETIEPNLQHPLSTILKKYKVRWECYFNYGNAEHVIGRNMVKLPVSLSIPYSNGYVILMPLFEEDKFVQVLNDLLDIIKKNYFQKNIISSSTQTPLWVNKYQINKEINLIKQFEEIKSELHRYNEIRKILYTTGIELTKAVAYVFSELGFKVIEKEHEGLHDIEAETDKFFSIIEVKGLKGHANVDDLRQLLDHHIEASKQNEDVKGIFILNHYKEDEPSNRKEPFSKDAIRLGTKNEFCMMTTIDLFKIYSQYIEGKIKIETIISRIKETKGPLKNTSI